MVEMGTIEQVDLREVWPHEAADFTPWLADNMERLGAALGMDLELQSSEAPVGPFALDILAHDLGSDRPVIIENQLEATNHDHLGKLLTYAAGYDAYAAVWLVRDFRDEHRQALDWLNQRTGEDTAFFGVVVEVVRIDGSRLAPQFRVVARPNEWHRHIANARKAQSARQGAQYRAFWRRFEVLAQERGFVSAYRPGPNWYHRFATDCPSVRWAVGCPPSGFYAGVHIDAGAGNDESSQQIYRSWHADREQIETELTELSEVREPLEWRPHPHRGYTVLVNWPGSIGDVAEYPHIMQAMVERLVKFREVFTPHLRELVE